MDKLIEAIKIAGNQARLAELVGVNPMAVSHWKSRKVPASRCMAIEVATDGRVTRQDLRPDIFGEVVNVSPAHEVS